MKYLDKLLYFLFLLGVFFIPFNSFEGLSFLGEFRNEAAVFFFLPGIIILFLSFYYRKKIVLPYNSLLFKVLIIFIFWCFFTTLLNLPTVAFNEFKGTNGINRFIRQFISLILSSFVFFLFYYNVLRNKSFEDILTIIRKVLLISLLFASLYGFFEALVVLYGKPSFRPILNLFNYFPFLNVKTHAGRLSSISYEPPFLAIYLITIAGWMYSYILTVKGVKKFIPTLLVITLGFLSGSRTALIVIFIQFFIFLVILSYYKEYKKYVYILFSIIIISIGTISLINSKKIIATLEEKIETLDFKSNLTESVSNKSRFGIQYASLQVFAENPILGVGFGQQTYHNRFKYPSWATLNNYEFRLIYKNEQIKSFPPGYNMYVRLLAETGIIGLLIFISFLTLIIVYTLQILKQKNTEMRALGVVLLISFIGYSINWLQFDTFRIYGFWICLAILILLKQASFKNKQIIKSN